MNVCRAKGNYGGPFKASRGVTQGGPLSAKLFNIAVNAVVWEWVRLMRATIDDADGPRQTHHRPLCGVLH
jgi:hypothetical protein